MKLDILAFGAHPDDVELACSGTLMVEIANGKKVGIVDLTEGELGTRGSVQQRYKEASDAAQIMEVAIRENLQLADGFFTNSKMEQVCVITAIRKYRPEIVLCNAPEDRHPDHGKGSHLLMDAAFLSGLRKIETFIDDVPQDPWRPKYVFQYIQDRFLQPDFVIDISTVHHRKIDSIKAYTSQFYNPTLDEPQTYISSDSFLDSVIYRSKMMGKMIGVEYAEGFISKKMIGFNSFDAFIKRDT